MDLLVVLSFFSIAPQFAPLTMVSEQKLTAQFLVGLEILCLELAHHFVQAETVLGTEKLVRYSIMAGERAISSNAYEEALTHFQRALTGHY